METAPKVKDLVDPVETVERHLPVVRYWHPEEFSALERAGYGLGFEHVAAGPLVRSSYHADSHVAQPEPGAGPLAMAVPA